MRDRYLQIISECGRVDWHKAYGYDWRTLVEADISCFKGVIGDGLRSRTDQRRVTEVAVAVNVLNRTINLEHPEDLRLP